MRPSTLVVMVLVLVVAAWVGGTLASARVGVRARLAIALPAARDLHTQLVSGPSDWRNIESVRQATGS